MGENSNNNTQSIADYLAQLLKDKKQLAAFPNVFIHLERLLDEEISKVRSSLFQINGMKKEPLVLPDGIGPPVSRSEKVYVPVKEHPDYNFVGRILGPRGMTAKQLEQETGCKIMVRGKGSMRDKKKEDMNRGKPNWEHLNDDLHVLITCEDSSNRAEVKLQKAVDEVRKLLVPVTEGEDELKKRQLMELAIINGTYRDSSAKGAGLAFENSPFAKASFTLAAPTAMGLALSAADAQRLMAGGPPPPVALASPLRTQSTPLGAPLILSPRGLPMGPPSTLLNGSGPPPPLIAPTEAGLLYAAYPDYHQYAALTSPLLAEYAPDHSPAGAAAKQRRHLAIREHPYQRIGSL
ncbi:protein held out wings isoform X1 [Dermacentor silvarum]|uniref:protein held out wings isoform X1 n=1 Tax=Dermacentor silvarum TaxID=543639 RepID=UPI00189BFA67|nr:protein held out wings isoform X1 [Dermacentor silvarum]